MQVLLDLHGAPGSQNGFDNSGRRGEIHWHEGGNPERTVRILVKVAEMVKSWADEGAFRWDTLLGLELVNEPAGFYDYIWNTCRDGFYQGAYAAIKTVFGPNPQPLVLIQQAFRAYSDFDGFMPDNVR